MSCDRKEKAKFHLPSVQQEVGQEVLVDEGLLLQLLDQVDPEVELLEKVALGEVGQGLDFVASQAAGRDMK